MPRVGLAEIKSGEPEYEECVRAQDLAGAGANGDGDVVANGRGVATNGGVLVAEQTEQGAEAATTMTDAPTNGIAHVDWETRESQDPEMVNGIGMNGGL